MTGSGIFVIPGPVLLYGEGPADLILGAFAMPAESSVMPGTWAMGVQNSCGWVSDCWPQNELRRAF